MSFNWADEVEEELAEAAGHGTSSTQFEQLDVKDTHIEDIGSTNLTPQVDSRAAENEPTCSTATTTTTTTPSPRDTPSPDAQPSARNSGIMQSRWANAPDEPAAVVVVEPHSEVSKDTPSLEQGGGHGTPSKNRRARGTNHSKKDSTQSIRSGRSSHTGSPKKANRESSSSNSKQAKARSTSTHNERAHITTTTPLMAAHASPKVTSISPSKSASKAANNDNNNSNQPAAATSAAATTTAVVSIIDKKIDGPVQTPGSSSSKNEISLSRWA